MQNVDLEAVFCNLPAGSITQRIHVLPAFEQGPRPEAYWDDPSPPGRLLQLYHQVKGQATRAQRPGVAAAATVIAEEERRMPPPALIPAPAQQSPPQAPYVLWMPAQKASEWKLGQSSTGRLYVQDPAGGPPTGVMGGETLSAADIRRWLLVHGLGMTRDALGMCKVPDLRQLCKTLNLKRSNINKAELLEQLEALTPKN